MINVPAQGVAQARPVPVLRANPALFWGIFVLVGAGIAVALLLIISTLPSRLPLARSADIQTVREAIWARVNGDVSDPLVELAPGVTARQSAMRGFSVGGRTYYYYFEGQPGFDPLSRGTLPADAIEVVLRDGSGPQVLVIYQVLRP
ncbi:MAG TPA: hypothetical protein PLO33_03525 [Kouleothrix sp.]|uniref:hypothetical protein n=1 Tax=Kouleothrix sp. TaxID=2779161 RepID=UPI002B8CF10E|nr:hypothetical protein [Kouleothrix sp.]HRC74721.1 hypothetical protein [Kouleothrix sp.]